MPAIEAATLENVPSITDAFLACFNDEYFTELFPPTEVVVKYVQDSFSAFLDDDSAGLFIIKDEQGNLASVLLFFEQPGGQPPRKWTTRWPAAREGMNGPMMEEFFLGMDGQHHQVMGNKQHTCQFPKLAVKVGVAKKLMHHNEHTDVELVFTLPSQQRKGYGTQMVKYVAELVGATQPLYLDSRESTVKLYEQLGFVKQDCDIEPEMIPMVKPVTRGDSV